MPKFAANLASLFQELPPPERFDAAKQAGFDGVEMPFPYDTNAQDIRNALSRYDLQMVLINAPPPNYTGGDPGWAARPDLQSRFQRDFRRVMRYGQLLRPHVIHVMAGKASGDQAMSCFVENLCFACAAAPDQKITIEVIDPRDVPGYFLTSYEQALEVLEAVNAANLSLQLRSDHAHRITCDFGALWARIGDHVGHVQITGHGITGHGDDSDHAALLETLDAAGYSGWVSAEGPQRPPVLG